MVGGGDDMSERDMKGGKNDRPLHGLSLARLSIDRTFFSLSFLTAFSFVCASQTRHYPSAICSFSPPLLVCDWFDAIWKGLQSGGSLVPFLSRMVASIQLPPSLSFSLSPCVSCVSCFSLCIHMDSSSVSSLLYLSPLRLYAGKAWVPLTSRFPPHTDSLEHFGFGNLGLSI